MTVIIINLFYLLNISILSLFVSLPLQLRISGPLAAEKKPPREWWLSPFMVKSEMGTELFKSTEKLNRRFPLF